jgi:carboxypeptidase Q
MNPTTEVCRVRIGGLRSATLQRFAIAAAVALLAAPDATARQVERIDDGINARIRDEGLNRSRIPELAGYLTEAIGPRLTGSPGMRRANDWTAEQLRGWGLRNARVEPWGEFGRGWERVSYYGRMTQPFAQPLQGQPAAWTGSTDGTIEGAVVRIAAETPEELFDRYRGRLHGAIVLPVPPIEVEPEFEAPTRRFTVEQLQTRPDVGPPAAPDPAAQQRFLRQAAFNAALDSLMRMERPALVLRPSPWQYGVIRVGAAGGAQARQAGAPEPPATVFLALEHYNQLWRNDERGVPTRVEFNVQNRFIEDDLRAYNTLAELPGSDRANEYVMIGAHLDSWHSGQGATDNAAGSVVMMEAMRILQAVGAQPRRTIMIALWSGEEQGLLGSRFWVENNRELWPRISAYLNVDNGTGRIRGIWNQMNEGATPIFRQILEPFRDLDVVAVRHGNTGGTDHLAFDRVGVPGFNFIQDPIEYGLRTHHSHMDTFDRLVLDDLRQAAVVVASTAYHLAMRDELMPRKPQP